MRERKRPRRRSITRRILVITAACAVLLVSGGIMARYVYMQNLRPVDAASQEFLLFSVEPGASLDEIAHDLHRAGLIRSVWAFKLYVGIQNAYASLQAGTYSLSPAHSAGAIVAQLTGGEIISDMVTILPGQRLDQIRDTLIASGFEPADVDVALDPATHADHPAFADKPAGNNLEGFLYPDTFHRDHNTSASDIVRRSLDEMQQHLTPQLREAFAAHGLNTYEGIILASIVEREAANEQDRAQIAQVFLSRLSIGMPLQADPTAHYGAYLDGAEPTVGHPSPYNTYMHPGLPPTPISNVSASSLEATAHPADTDWLYFVAGDDGRTHFTRTLQEHEEATRRYCTQLCP